MTTAHASRARRAGAPRSRGPQAPSARGRRGRSMMVLAWLTLGVLVAHGWLIRSWPDSLNARLHPSSDAPQVYPAVVTRTLPAAPASGGAQASPPKPSPSPAPVPATAIERPAARPPAPTSTSAAALAPVAEPPASQVIGDAAPPTAPSAGSSAAEPAATAASSPATASATPQPSAVVMAEPLAPDAAARLTAAPPRPWAVPAPIRIKYNVLGETRQQPFRASAELLWRHDDVNYSAQMEVGVFLLGRRTQTSNGRVTAARLEPLRFADKARSELAAHFERATPQQEARVVFSANTPSIALQDGAQDRLSLFMQLAGLLAADPAYYAAGRAVTLQTVGARDAEVWTFMVQGPETLSLGSVDVPTLKLLRAPRREFDQQVELWFAPQLGWMPARIKITQASGDFVDQQWRASSPP